MGRFTKRLILGLTAALTLAAGGAYADFLLDDMEGGSNENKMGYYWYFFAGDDDRIAMKKAQDVAGKGYQAVIKNAGPGDQYGVFSFEPHATTGKTGSSAALIYENLNYANLNECTDEKGCERYPTIGMGTSLTESDDTPYGAGFNGVTSIKFWMKAKDVDTVFFKVETIENSVTGEFGPTNVGIKTDGQWPKNPKDLPGKYDKNPSNAWIKKIHPTAEWVEYEVKIADATGVSKPGTAIDGDGSTSKPNGATGTAGDLKQDNWWGYSFEFKKKNATKLAWQINNDKNTKKAGELYVDDVRLIGTFTYVPADQCLSCPGKTLPTSGLKLKLSDFENADPLQNSLGFYWYAYDDKNAGGTTEISDYWTENEHTGETVLDAKGHGNGGNGVEIAYSLGKSFPDKSGTTITPFAGIGTNLFDTTAMVFMNATGATGIYFEYKTENVDFLAVEFSDASDVANAGKNGDNDDGQVFYKKIPGDLTNKDQKNKWTGVIIPFDSLVLPRWIKDGDRRFGSKLTMSQLAKIQFKYQGTTNGKIAIDNVYILGLEGAGEPNRVKHVGSKAMVAGLRATYSRGAIGVNWNAATSITSGSVQLVNTKGRVVASAPIASASGKVTANLNAGTIPTGMYFVRVNAKDVNGKKIVQQASISVVK